ncbi:hypothetical protein BRD03_04840 [Halobacteriales archaeon QS_9_68_17]|nr:MAG: hypothetical protein BRD03_04840 [Halobacteriales archaeon QS_9_68_17]
MSFLLNAVNGVRGRIWVAVGVLLALGPFDHVVVSVSHVAFGVFFGAPVGLGEVAAVMAVATAGNSAGGPGPVAPTHSMQAMGSRGSDDADD